MRSCWFTFLVFKLKPATMRQAGYPVSSYGQQQPAGYTAGQSSATVYGQQPAAYAAQPVQSTFVPQRTSYAPVDSPPAYVPSAPHATAQASAAPMPALFVPSAPPAPQPTMQLNASSMFLPQATAAPQPMAMVPKPAGFVPSSASPPPPGMVRTVAPQAPAQQVSQAAPAPAVPPPPSPPAAPVGVPANCTAETVDTSNVAPESRPVVASLLTLFGACAQAAGSNVQKKREMDDNSKRLGGLLWKLNRRDVSPGVVGKLLQVCIPPPNV